MARRMSLLAVLLILGIAAAGYGALHYMTSVPGKPHTGALPPLTPEEAALALEPDHVSAYALTIDDRDGVSGSDHLPPRTGATQWRARARQEQDEDRAADMYEMADEMLLASQKIVPARLEASGYEFLDRTIDDALRREV